MDNGTIEIPHQAEQSLPEIQPAGLPRSELERITPSLLSSKQRQRATANKPPARQAPPPPIAPNPPLAVDITAAAPSAAPPPPQPTSPPPPPAVSPAAPADLPPINPARQTSAPQATVKTVNPPVKSKPNSTQNSLQIAEVRDGIVIMNDGSFRCVLMAKSINFDLMSPQEQEAVEGAYQGFLNSLYFPLQIFVRSQKVDLGPYIDKLDKIRTEHDNMLLIMLMEDYINFIDQLSQQTNIMDKKFYIVIPYTKAVDAQKAIDQSKSFVTGLANLFNHKGQQVVINEKDLEDAKNELRNRINAVLSGLLQCGVQALPLDTQELIELYYDTYNPDTATRQELKDFSSLTADVVTKGQGQAPQAHLKSELN